MLLENNQFIVALVLLIGLACIEHAGAGSSCLDHGIDVCCTSDHCPEQQSPDGCFCDENCAQFGDCCDDIDQLCTNYKESCNSSSIRLVDGGSDLQGRVEVCVDGEWGTVCDHGWSSIDAQVVCAQLNMSNSGAQGLKSARFQEGLGSIHMASVNCVGNESSLFECSFTNETSFCNHGMDASVICGEAQCVDREVRLMDGTRDTEGRVEVCLNGVWGTVCDHSWDRSDATVVCNQLGLSTTRVIAKGGSYFGSVTGPINMNNVGCTGSEGSIFDCSFNENSQCTHNDDAGVICGYQQGCIDGLIRLADGKNSSEGRVEVCIKGAWNTICDEGWDDYAAKVICREIGYDHAGAIAIGGGYFKSGSELTDVYFANVTCTGHERSILHCDYTTPTISVCPHSKDAGVRCFAGPGHCTDNAIRLVDGPDSSQGRVEVCLFERWGTVCDSRWSTQHAEVVCRELGLPEIGATALSGAYYGIGTGPINMDNVICTGNENNLTSCSFTSNEMSCTHANDAGVRCPCVHGDVRLAGTPTPSAGRVEVCYFGSWGTVTDDGWNNVDSNVVCRQLGYWANVSYAVSFAFFGAGSGPIHLDNTGCDGTEDELLDCFFTTPSTADTHSEDAGVICFDGNARGDCLDGSIRLADGSTPLEGRIDVCIVGVWGTVCHIGWGYNDAAVVCDQLGYPRVGTAFRGLSYSPGRGRIYMSNTACDSTHQSLLECPYSLPFSPPCSHLTDAGVKCYESSNCTHGDVRLVNGPTLNQGRVEVCFRGVWGSVTSSLFGDEEAKVVCSQLGYFKYLAVPQLNAFYGANNDNPIVLDGLRCRGDEASLTDCPSREVLIQSTHALDAGVYCYTNITTNGACLSGSIRLSDGSTDREGRVEVCLDGAWSSVCGYDLSTNVANVVCRQLGHTGYGSSALPGSYFKNSNPNQSMSISSLSCVGHEDSIWECVTSAVGVCVGGLEASIKCQPKVCTEGDLRLMDGTNDFEGRVEVCIDGNWGTLCDDGWSKESSLVICKQLGHSDQFALGYNSAYFGAGVSMPILMDNVQCTGNETRLIDCLYDSHTADCSHNEDVGVKCYPLEGFTGSGGECQHGEIRLVNGSTSMEGRIELCIDEHWGTVCNDRFTYVDGIIVCRQLGYSDLGATIVTDSRYGQGSDDLPIYIDNAACTGDEDMLLDCLFDPHTADCGHDRDVGVKCTATGECVDGSIRLVNGSRPSEGRVEVCSGGVWGTIAGVTTRFDNNAARVACRQLGYSDKYVLPMGPSFGSGEGPVHGYAIQCEGDEPNVLNCNHLKVPLNAINPHVADIGIRCFNLTDAPCTPGDVRLVNGSVNTSSSIDGRVEVCLDGEWGTLCGDYWIEDDSRVVCAQLGYSKYAALTLPQAYYGLGNVSTDEVSVHFVPICQGSEINIMDCELYHVETCTHDSDTALRCYKGDSCTEGETRLITQDGVVGDKGRLEVCQHGIWGTVCEDLFSKTDARVTCRQLGYTDTFAVSFVGAYYGEGNGPIHLDNVQCVGNEDSLLDCVYDGITDDCTHSQDVGVACYNESQCEHGAVRLVNGNYSYEGRVEYCLNGIWGTICDTYWDYYDAITVCKQLGIEDQYAVGYTDAYYGEGRSEIVLTAVDCLNQQPNINQCFRTQNVEGCTHSQDVGVACYPERQCPTDGDVRLLDGGSPLEGRVEVCLNGLWGSIASNQWDTNDAIVVCKQLGYIGTDALAIGGAQYGVTNGRINMHQVDCTGGEDSLLQCGYLTFTVFRDHDEDAGVRCFQETNCTTGDVRLMGGDNPMVGRVEVCIDSSWSTVNMNGWGYTESRVVCDQLGYSSEVAFLESGFGIANGPIGITDVDCTGSEGYLLNCTFSTITDSLDHSGDVGIRCYNDTTGTNTTCSNGAVRLFGGKTEYEGTVEVCLGGVWGSICYFGWDSNDAQVICSQLGYAAHDNPEVFAAFFGQSSGPILLDNINCDGTESSIAECIVDSSPRGACTHFHDAGVRCLEKSCVEDSIRLVGGSTPAEGRVEVCMNGIWGTVCDESWNTPDARVVCRQLGYSDIVGIAYTHGIFGHGTGPIAVRNTQCTGTESTLSTCQYDRDTDTCSHGNDAGVKCYNTTGASDVCALGDVRLVGGAGSHEGSVEVCLDNEWGTVCDDQWSNVDSGIVCTQLGYSFASTVFMRGFFPSNSTAIHLDDVSCTGLETSIVQCPFDYHVVDCTHAKDAGVKCYPTTNCSGGDVRLVGGPGIHEGRLEVCFSGVWGTVHGSPISFLQWSEYETSVICGQLGLNRTGSSPGTGDYGTPTGPVAFSNVICQGFEQSISECFLSVITTGLSHSLDVSVRCQPPPPLCYDGDLRLVGSSVPHWGRIEVCFNETWGTITDDLWSYNDGLVACRQLGYSDRQVVIRSNAYFGEGSGPIYMDNVRCTGTETNLVDCQHTKNTERDTHSEDAGLQCFLTSNCTHGDIKLVNGSSPSEGIVSICLQGIWGTIRDSFWSSANARLACGQLGYSNKYAVALNGLDLHSENPGYLPVVVNGFFCGGFEERLIDCFTSSFPSFEYNQVAGVQCYPDGQVGNCSLGEIRLVDGQVAYEGRIEMCVNGEWGTICNEDWTSIDARVACRQLGFTDTASGVTAGGAFGEGSGKILFRSVDCDGDEANLLDCYHDSILAQCTHSSDAGVLCHPGDGCLNGEVRLIGNTSYAGRVEVCVNGVWGTVCHDYWGTDDARVVCNQLNLPSQYPVAFREAFYGAGNIPIVMGNVICGGSEANLTQCEYDFDTSDCSHLHDVGVACLSEAQCINGSVRLINDNMVDQMSGRVEVCVEGVWGTICDNGFSVDEAKVVCKSMNLTSDYAVPYHGGYFGEGSGPIFYEIVSCEGDELKLSQCSAGNEVDCLHSQDVGVACLAEPQCDEDGLMRLVNGSDVNEGRLEVCLRGVWGTVTDSFVDTYTARTLCRIMGFEAGGNSADIQKYGEGNGPIHLDNIFCRGRETSILDCIYSEFTLFNDHSEDIALYCYKSDNCTEGEIRLVNGSSTKEGRIELCLTNTFGTVAYNILSPVATVICRQLGFTDKFAIPYSSHQYGQGVGPISVNALFCNGNEESVTGCTYFTSFFFLDHFYDAGVKCFEDNELNITGNCQLGSTRLVGGNSSIEGRVEVCVNEGQWSTICINFLSQAIANTVCSTQEFASIGALALSSDGFGPSNASILLRDLYCTGQEANPLECEFRGNTVGCTHEMDLAVRCLEKECVHGDVRLVDGDTADEGRVEVCVGGRWGTICDDDWDQYDASVVCKQLGYNSTYALPYHFDHFTGSEIPIAMDGIHCNGDESSWSECVYTTQYVRFCNEEENSGVKCFNDISSSVCDTGDHRLVDGEGSYEGRIEVCVGGEWSTVCREGGWDTENAEVACRATYGETDVALTYFAGHYGNGTGPIYLADVSCGGYESSLLDCGHTATTRNCDHTQDIGVRCRKGDECTVEGEVKLVGGSGPHEGRIEICINGVWGTFATPNFPFESAIAVCNQLGYSTLYADTLSSDQYGPGKGVIHFTYAFCSFPTTKIINCSSSAFYDSYATHQNDVGLRCYGEPTDGGCMQGSIRLVNGSSQYEGRVELCLNNQWGTLAVSFWNENSARVTCYQAGFAGPGAEVLDVAPGTGLIQLTDISCSGHYYSLFSCFYGNNSIDNTHAQDAGVKCRPADNCTEGDIRLSGGDRGSGFVEVCLQSAWSTISESYLTQHDADVICRSIGYPYAESYSRRGSTGPPTSLPIGLTFFYCSPRRNHFTECSRFYSPFGANHDNDIAVTCYQGITTASTGVIAPPTMTSSEIATPTITRRPPPTLVSSAPPTMTSSEIATPTITRRPQPTIVSSAPPTMTSSMRARPTVTNGQDGYTTTIERRPTPTMKESTDYNKPTTSRSRGGRPSRESTSSTVSMSTSIISVLPSSIELNTLSVGITGDFDSTTFPRDDFKRSVAESANEYCETSNNCRKKRSLNIRQNNQVTADDVVIVEVADMEGGGVTVSFYVMSSGDRDTVIEADTLYEAVKMGIEEGVFERAGFDSITVEPPPTAAPPAAANKGGMTAGTKAGIAITVIVVLLLVMAGAVVILLIVWLKRKNRHFEADKDHILTNRDSFISNRDSMIEIDTKPTAEDHTYITVASSQSDQMPVNEKLQFKKLDEDEEGEITDKDVKTTTDSTL